MGKSLLAHFGCILAHCAVAAVESQNQWQQWDFNSHWNCLTSTTATSCLVEVKLRNTEVTLCPFWSHVLELLFPYTFPDICCLSPPIKTYNIYMYDLSLLLCITFFFMHSSLDFCLALHLFSLLVPSPTRLLLDESQKRL